jgi:hypothetical protein
MCGFVESGAGLWSLSLGVIGATVPGFCTARGAARLGFAGIGVAGLLLASNFPDRLAFILAHIHNLTAVPLAFYFLLGTTTPQSPDLPMGVGISIGVCFIVFYLGFATEILPFARDAGQELAASLDPGDHYPKFFPGSHVAGAMGSFVFAQLCHLLAWSVILPSFRPREWPWHWIVVGLGLAIAWVLMWPTAQMAKMAYIQLAGFHSWLELGFIGLAVSDKTAPHSKGRLVHA